MIRFRMVWILFCALAMTGVCLRPSPAPAETPCERAEELLWQSMSQTDPAAQKASLEEAVDLCPDQAPAWNNLGVIYENEGQLGKAKEAYQRAAMLDIELGAPLAGLGDIAMIQGRFQEAAQWYGQFLAFLAAELRKGDPRGLGLYEQEYRLKYEQANLKWHIHQASMNEVVSNTTLTRGMRGIRTRQKISKPTGPERLALSILFDFNSAALKPQGQAQLGELARAMASAELRFNRFVVEGHTDTYGSNRCNLDLSLKRAGEVRAFLVSQGISLDRLKVKGYGKAKPIVASGRKAEQAVNRRVEFVKLGP